MSNVRLFIQARMSSTRFPGKMLAPFNGRPLIEHVVSRVARALPLSAVTVATSDATSDDPLALYVRELGVSVFRGPLDDVFRRFQLCLEGYPADWVFRLTGDSPLVDADLVRRMQTYSDEMNVDLVTNVFPRTFPKGRTLEMIKADTFLGIDSTRLTPYQREHLTTLFYDNPERFRILNIESGDATQTEVNLSVDSVDDLRRLEAIANGCDESLTRAVRGREPGL